VAFCRGRLLTCMMNAPAYLANREKPFPFLLFAERGCNLTLTKALLFEMLREIDKWEKGIIIEAYGGSVVEDMGIDHESILELETDRGAVIGNDSTVVKDSCVELIDRGITIDEGEPKEDSRVAFGKGRITEDIGTVEDRVIEEDRGIAFVEGGSAVIKECDVWKFEGIIAEDRGVVRNKHTFTTIRIIF